MGRDFPENSIGWYRKTFFIPASDLGKRISIDFDGVFRNSIVWVNGFYLGQEHSGYSSFSYDITDYLNQLPLEHVTQIHLSGPRENNGRLFDAHEPLQEEDYRLLEFTLGKCAPQVVTLEYVREPEALRAQIRRLRHSPRL